MEVLGNSVGRAGMIYADDVKVIGRSVEDLIVNRTCGAVVVYGAGVVPCGAKARTVCRRGTERSTRGRPSDTTQGACVNWWRCVDQRRWAS